MSAPYFPVFLKLEGRKCVVVGAGRVAVPKIRSLLESCAHVTAIAPDADEGVRVLSNEGRLRLLMRPYRTGDLDGAYLVIAATNDTRVNQEVYDDAHRRGCLVNVVDTKPLCDYITPASVRREDLTVAISTNGLAPALASVIRRHIERMIDERYAPVLRQARQIRRQITSEAPSFADKRALWYEIIRLCGANTDVTRSLGEALLALNRDAGAAAYGHIGMIGFDHWNTPLSILERLKLRLPDGAISFEDFISTDHSGMESLAGYVVVSTCHRYEVYFEAEHEARAARGLRRRFASQLDVQEKELKDLSACRKGLKAIEHLHRVATGLESAVLLEREIHGQVRRAYRRAVSRASVSPSLSRVFESAIGAGRLAQRTIAADHRRSLAYRAVEIVARQLDGFEDLNATVVGTGSFSRAVQRALADRGIRTTACDPGDSNSTVKDTAKGRILVLSCARVRRPVISRAQVAQWAASGRRIYLFDLGLPRNIEPAVKQLHGVMLWDLDDLADPSVFPQDSPDTDGDRVRGLVGRVVRRFRSAHELPTESILSVPVRSDRPAPATKALGRVTLVGAGPGEAGLLTLRGRDAIANADVILYDRLVGADILEFARRDSRKITVGKEPGPHQTNQEDINSMMLDHALEGRTVVRLKGGDPFIFGRGGEEVDFLRAHGVECEVVPGVSSVTGVATAAGIPLTSRNRARSFAVVTAKDCGNHKQALIRISRLLWDADSVVVLMGKGRLAEIAEHLLREGFTPQTPIALIENGATKEQRTIAGTLSDIAERSRELSSEAPGLIIIGEAARVPAAQSGKSHPLNHLVRNYARTSQRTLAPNIIRAGISG